MNIRAKKNTEFESAVKGMCEQIQIEHEKAKDMVEEAFGIRPICIGYIWHFTITAHLSCDVISFPQEIVPPHFFIQNKEFGNKVYKLNRRLKKSKEFIEVWENTFKGIDGKILQSKFGIPIMSDRVFSHWMPCKDDNGYYISTSSSVFDRMKKTESDSFYVESKSAE